MLSSISWTWRAVASIAVVVGAAVACAVGGLGAHPAFAATCSDVDVVFARGTGELPGLGIVGSPFVSAVTSNLPGKSVSSYAVDYVADVAQLSAGAGATDISNHVKQVASDCPDTKFVLGGYSQGASATDIAIGIPTFLGAGETIPTDLSPRIKAVVAFGNPLKIFGQTIATASALYGPASKDYCNSGDPVCANGFNLLAHLTYGIDGSASDGATFAADMLQTT